MLTETGQVFSIEPDSLVVQVIQQSTCGSCSAQKGCGQGVLTKYLSSSHFVRIRLTDRPSEDFSVGDQVELGIDELAIIRAASLVYLLPLVSMICWCSLCTSPRSKTYSRSGLCTCYLG